MNITKPSLLTLAIALLAPWTTWAEPSSLDYANAGLKLYQEKNYALAEKYFGASLQTDPNNWKAAQLLGNAQLQGGNREEALRSYEKSLQINPSNNELSKYVESLRAIIAPGQYYVWDPAVDPYPRVTGPALPLPKPWTPVGNNLYLTAAYSHGTNMISFGSLDYGGEKFSYDFIPLRLHYQINPIASIALGTEIWPALKTSYIAPPYSYSSPGYSETETRNDSAEYDITPVSFGIFIHSWGKALSFDAGVNIVTLFYKLTALSHNTRVVTGSYPSTSEENYSTVITGWGFGGGLEMNLNFKLDPHFGIFLTTEANVIPSYSYSLSLAKATYLDTESTTDSSSNYSYTWKGNYDYPSLGMLAASVGLGIEAGF